jgi:hypothetical protein
MNTGSKIVLSQNELECVVAGDVQGGSIPAMFGLEGWSQTEALGSAGVGGVVIGTVSGGTATWAGAGLGFMGYTIGIMAGNLWCAFEF